MTRLALLVLLVLTGCAEDRHVGGWSGSDDEDAGQDTSDGAQPEPPGVCMDLRACPPDAEGYMDCPPRKGWVEATAATGSVCTCLLLSGTVAQWPCVERRLCPSALPEGWYWSEDRRMADAHPWPGCEPPSR